MKNTAFPWSITGDAFCHFSFIWIHTVPQLQSMILSTQSDTLLFMHALFCAVVYYCDFRYACITMHMLAS